MIRLKYFFELIRWQNLAIIILTLILLRYLALSNPALSVLKFVVLILGTVLIAAAGNIINDIFDVEIDLINKPEQVIIQQHISIKTAWVLYSAFNIFAILLGCYLQNPLLLILFLTAILLLWLYSKYLKKKALIGNVVIALLCAWVVIEFWMLEYKNLNKNWQLILTAYTLFAYFATLSRELIKDLQDKKGDKREGCRTFPIVYGDTKTKIIIYFSYLFLLLILFWEAIFFCQIGNYIALFYTLFGLILGLLFLTYNTFFAKNRKDYKQLSQSLKVYMLMGLGLLLLT